MTEIIVSSTPGWAPIVALAATGDEVAFARLINAYDPAMGRVAFVIAGDWTIAAEAVQTAWIIAWSRLRTLRDPDRIESWLVSIAANETRRLLARQRRRTVVEMAFITQKEPALTASFLAAVLLAIVARCLDLTDEDLAILGPVALILAGVVIRTGVFSPATVTGLIANEERARGG